MFSAKLSLTPSNHFGSSSIFARGSTTWWDVRDCQGMGKGFIYSSVGAFVYDTEVFPAVLPEINAVVDRVQVEVMEGL